MHRRRWMFAIAAIALIGVGLLTRWPAIPWNPVLAKYLGAGLWGAMVYCVVGLCVPARTIAQIAMLALGVAVVIEASQLWHPPWLDAFRATTIGVLLLGRYFAWLDIVAYAVGIGAAAVLTVPFARR